MGLTPERKAVEKLVALFGATLVLILGLAACVKKPDSDTPIDDNTSDQMWDKQVSNEEFYVFQLGEETIMVSDHYYTVDVSRGEPLEDGGFYKVKADVTYLNGGVAGYVDFPQITHVTSIEKASPFDIGLPSLAEKRYGLMLIGDYADGDVLFNEHDTMAVWKDGSWLFRYGSRIELADETLAGVAKGITAEDVQAGIKEGILCCKDYFALLPDSSTPSKTQDEIPADSILLFNNDKRAAKLKSDMDEGKVPSQCDALFDAMGSRPSVIVTDPETITELYRRLSQMTIGPASQMSVTDAYHRIAFTLQDGTKVGWNFETEAYLCGTTTNYEAHDNADLWGYVSELQERQ